VVDACFSILVVGGLDILMNDPGKRKFPGISFSAGNSETEQRICAKLRSASLYALNWTMNFNEFMV
jgi:hypothetical protein